MKQVKSKRFTVISTVTVAILLVALGALSLVQLTAADTHHYDAAGFCTDADCTRYEPAAEVNGVYRIENAGNLFWFAALVNGDTANADIDAQNAAASAVLVADIDLGSREWTPMQGFAGSFDGAGHRIDNLKITAAGHTHVGLFGGTAEGSNAVIKNFNLTGEIHMSGGASDATLGSVIGNAHTSTVLGVRSYVNITVEAGSTFQHVGGLCGNADGNSASEGLLAECLYAGSFTLAGKADQIGGIAGRIGIADIRDCVNQGRLTVMECKYVGGILGYVNYANANVDRTISVGSIVLSEGNTVQYVGMVLGRVRNHGTMTQNYYVSAGTSNGAGRVESSAETVETSTANALEFATGKFAYELGQYEGSPWGQTLSSPKDQTPLPGSPKVNYGYINCTEQTYTNAAVTEEPGAHVYENGFCTLCDAYEPPVVKNGTYEIGNAGQLYWLAKQVNSGALGNTISNIFSAALTANITVNDDITVAEGRRAWVPIGSTSTVYMHFDGRGHTVSGLFMSDDSCLYGGLIGDLSNGSVKNVAVVNSHIAARLFVGTIVGYAVESTIENCLADAHTETLSDSSTACCGGLAGNVTTTTGKTVQNCLSVGTQSGYGKVHELIPGTYSTPVSNCFYLSDTETDTIDGTTAVTAGQLRGGEVAYALGSPWGQVLGPSEHPYLGGAPVYRAYLDCTDVWTYYTNNEDQSTPRPHTYENGFCTVCDAYEPAVLNGGTYEISNAGQLYWFAEQINGGTIWFDRNNPVTVVLCADITVNEDINAAEKRDWVPIGTGTTASVNFDAQGHTVSGLYMEASDIGMGGLFGSVQHGYIRNLAIVNSSITAGGKVGGLAGSATLTQIDNIYVDATVRSLGTHNVPWVSGIVADYDCSTALPRQMNNCLFVGTMSGGTKMEPITCGDAQYVFNCYYLSDTETDTLDGTTAVTEAQLRSGEVAYKLGNAFGQTLGTDAYPSIGGAPVFYGGIGCVDMGYSNDPLPESPLGHIMVNGFCTECGICDTPRWDADANAYMISNAGELYWFAALVNGELEGVEQNTSANAYLTQNITVNENVIVNGALTTDTASLRMWTPIGTNHRIFYRGVFDGKGYEISGLYYNEYGHAGLFGRVGYRDSSAEIRNVAVVDSYFANHYDDSVGGICAELYDATVTHCRFDGIVYSETSHVGGIVGYAPYGTITHCINEGLVSTSSTQTVRFMGGIVAYLSNGYVANCINKGSFSNGENWPSGGIVGVAAVTVENCLNLSTGAVGGQIVYTNDPTAIFSGYPDPTGQIINCYYDSTLNPDALAVHTPAADASLIVSVSGMTSAQLRSGEVAYKLGAAFGQTLGTDAYPSLGGATVYYGAISCTEMIYTNNALPESIPHTYEGGFCTACGGYEPAVWNSDTNAYEIANAGQLYWFAALVDGRLADVPQNISANAILVADITVNENVIVNGALTAHADTLRVWNPIGEADAFYGGTFNGKGYTVSGLYTCGINDDCGLFAYVGDPTGATTPRICHVAVVDSYFEKNDINSSAGTLGGICSSLLMGEIENCRFSGILKRGGATTGGIVGVVLVGSVTDCINEGTIYALHAQNTTATGGIVGQMAGGTVRNCIHKGAFVDVSEELSGGIAGVVGSVPGYGDGVVEYCLSIGTGVTGGGIVGTNIGSEIQSDFTDGYVRHCYYDSTLSPAISGVADPAADASLIVSVSGMTSAQLSSGEVAYKLGSAWGQTLGTDAYPSLGGATVYYGAISCSEMGYANNSLPASLAHTYDNGFCTVCDVYEPAVWNASANAYEISNAGQLYWFAALVDGTLEGVAQNTSANAYLTRDITVNENVLVNGALTANEANLRVWNPIGSLDAFYNGIFDGNGYTVSGLYAAGEAPDCGLVAYAGDMSMAPSAACIRNVAVVDSYFRKSQNTSAGSLGGICSILFMGKVRNCRFDGLIVNDGAVVGGIVGGLVGGSVTECVNEATFIGENGGGRAFGGIVGQVSGGLVLNCLNIGSFVDANRFNCGGIVYMVASVPGLGDGIVENCLNIATGEVGGGIAISNVGTQMDASYTDGYIKNCYYDAGKAITNTGVMTSASSGYTNYTGYQSNLTAKGDIAYKLGEPWGQTIGTDAHPILGGARVYYTYADSCIKSFSNDVGSTFPIHHYENGVCTKCDTEELPTHVVTFTKPADWSEVYIYLWDANSVTVGAAWPGQTMTSVGTDDDGNEIYSIECPNEAANLIFNNGTGVQTVDIPMTSGAHYRLGDAVGEKYDVVVTLPHEHTFENGFCSCGDYEPAVWSESAGAYEISNAGQLYWFAALVNGTLTDGPNNNAANAFLTQDIIVNENVIVDGALTPHADALRTWTPIGTYESPYRGVFDGCGYAVSGLYVNGQNCGFFGEAGDMNGSDFTTRIENVAVVDSYFERNGKGTGSNGNIAGICTYMYAGVIIGCRFDGIIQSEYASAGGIVGMLMFGTVTECVNEGTISVSDNSIVSGFGGIAKGVLCGTVSNCINKGTLNNLSYESSGGIVGFVASAPGFSDGIVENCLNIGTGTVGGAIVGTNDGTLLEEGMTPGKVINCYYDTDKFPNTPAIHTPAADATAIVSVSGVTPAQMASGEVAYKLGEAFGQTLGTDTYPTLGGATVYYTYADSCSAIYSNTQGSASPLHSYENGVCTVCGVNRIPEIIDGVFQIGTVEELYWFADLVNGFLAELPEEVTAAVQNGYHAVLTADIVINENLLGRTDYSDCRPWTPIGYSFDAPFVGSFDGQGHTISGIYAPTPNTDSSAAGYNGLFGYADYMYDEWGTVILAEIKNIHVKDSYLLGLQPNITLGGIVAYGTLNITNCSFEGVLEGVYVGGILGSGYAGLVTGCTFDGTIYANVLAGGIVGDASMDIRDCRASGTVVQTDMVHDQVIFGGIAGMISNMNYLGEAFGSIENCLSTMRFELLADSIAEVGAIAGSNDPVGLGMAIEGDYAVIRNCYYLTNDATVTGVAVIGGKDYVTDLYACTEEMLASGEIAYRLGGAWGQSIGTDALPGIGLSTVYASPIFSACNEETVIGLTYSNNSLAPSTTAGHYFIDGVCSCGTAMGDDHIGYGLILGGEIGLRFYMDIPTAYRNDLNARIRVTAPDGSYIDLPLHDGAVAWNETLSRATLTFYVAAKDMTVGYTAQLVTSQGRGTPQLYSVEAYAEYVFTIIDTAESMEVFETYYPYAAILDAMLRYGYHAQTYFEQDIENRTDLVEPELRETAIPNEYAAVISGEMAADVPLSYIGSTLLLESNTVFRHYFTLTASAADYDMTQADFDSHLFREFGIRPSAENPGLYCYESAPVAPTALGEKQTFRVGRYSLKIEYCPLSYAYAVLNSETTSQELKNVCLALFEYYVTVSDWLEIHTGTV